MDGWKGEEGGQGLAGGEYPSDEVNQKQFLTPSSVECGGERSAASVLPESNY